MPPVPRIQNYKNEKNESTKLKALSDIASIDISLEFDTILKQILKITCCSMKALSGTIMLVEKESGELRMVSSYGFPDNYPEIVHEAAKKAGVNLTFSPSGTVLETGKYYLVPDIFKEPKTKPWYDITREIGFSSIIYNPMKDGKNVFGLLNIYWADPRIFTDDEINFAIIATSQAASLVQNARMCTRLKNSIQELNGYKEHLEENIKKANIALYESEVKYRELFENAPYAMYVVNNEGNFLNMNQGGLQQLGYSREEIIGNNISKFVTPESLKIVQERQKKRLLGEILHQTDVIEIVCKDGEHRWIEINDREIKKGDMIMEIHGIARDITENIILKNKLNKSNKQKKLLCHLIEGSRGGKTRAKIMKSLIGKSYNAHQLADILDLDYKTIRHHLDVLSKHGMITGESDGHLTLYFISKNIESDLNEIYLGTQNDKKEKRQ
jgi:PAS domain S-box-containing protein